MSDASVTEAPLRAAPLDEIESLLQGIGLDVARQPDTLVIRHQDELQGERLVTRISVMAPAVPRAEAEGIAAVIRVHTVLPEDYARRFNPEMVAFANRFAALGAMTTADGTSFVGSRLTVRQGDDGWRRDLPIVVCAATAAAPAITGGLRRFLMKEKLAEARSAWTAQDMDAAAAVLSGFGTCTRTLIGLTAEFQVSGGAALSREAGARTAFLELLTAPPHVELGLGLLCLLQLAPRFQDAPSRHALLNVLNLSEMNSPDLPPHFGAWCEGKGGDNPAYVGFLPNRLHAVPDIAARISGWAKDRAEAAIALLAAARRSG